MATFTEIYYNGNEYKQMWLNGTKVWEKSSGGGEIVYPYPDADCVITYMCSTYSDTTVTFDIIDKTLPYSINGTSTNSFTFPAGRKTQLKFVNLKPCTKLGYVLYLNVEQLRLPNLTDLSYLFSSFCRDSNYTYSWSPQYFEFNENPTNMSNMFYLSKITDDMMNQLMPYFPNTSNVTDMNNMFYSCTNLTSLNVSNFNTSNVTNMSYMFDGCQKLTSLDVSNFNTSNVTNMSYMFYYSDKLTSLDLSSFDTSKTDGSNMFTVVKNCTIYISDKWTLDTSSTAYGGENLTFIEKIISIESIQLSHDIEDVSSVAQKSFVITPSILPTNYNHSDLEIVYDSTYMSVNSETNRVTLKDGCQGLTHTVTYRSKTDNSISDTITFAVSQDLVIEEETKLIDFTQSTAPTLPSCITLDGQGSSYYFKHGTYTTNVYGLVPNNNGINSSVAYTRYKFVAPKDGALTFTYRCYAETNYDYLTVHVDTSTSQPSYSSSTNQVLTTYGVSSYQTTDGTASVNVTQGTTYYIHIQYRKDSSGHNGYDKGCIRRIELVTN